MYLPKIIYYIIKLYIMQIRKHTAHFPADCIGSDGDVKG